MAFKAQIKSSKPLPLFQAASRELPNFSSSEIIAQKKNALENRSHISKSRDNIAFIRWLANNKRSSLHMITIIKDVAKNIPVHLLQR